MMMNRLISVIQDLDTLEEQKRTLDQQKEYWLQSYCNAQIKIRELERDLQIINSLIEYNKEHTKNGKD